MFKVNKNSSDMINPKKEEKKQYPVWPIKEDIVKVFVGRVLFILTTVSLESKLPLVQSGWKS